MGWVELQRLHKAVLIFFLFRRRGFTALSLPLHTTIISRRLRSPLLLRKWYVSLPSLQRVAGRGEGRRATRDDRARNQVIRTRLLSAYPATRKLSIPSANLPKTTICDSLRRKLHTRRISKSPSSNSTSEDSEDTAAHAVEKGTASLLPRNVRVPLDPAAQSFVVPAA